MFGKRRDNVGIDVQLLLLVRSGVGVRTNLMYFTAVNWVKFKKIITSLESLGYVSVDGSNFVTLTEKGKRFCSFVDEYFDLFSKDLNSFYKYS